VEAEEARPRTRTSKTPSVASCETSSPAPPSVDWLSSPLQGSPPSLGQQPQPLDAAGAGPATAGAGTATAGAGRADAVGVARAAFAAAAVRLAGDVEAARTAGNAEAAGHAFDIEL